jgi:hypothetical protein
MDEQKYLRCGEKRDTREIVAKVKFWFGVEVPIFDTTKYTVEYHDQFAYIYKK